jgi:hypothetical protein
MSFRKTFKTDQNLEVEGVEIEVGINEFNGEPMTIRIARMSKANKRYTKRLEAVTRPHQSAIQNESLDNELAQKMLQGVFVDTILLGWNNVPKYDLTGVEADKDVLLDYNRENALALFAEMPDLYDDWEDRAKKAASFREKEREDAAGN